MQERVFAGRYENLAKLGAFVASNAKLAGLDEEEIYAVELAVDEAASNIIEHGYQGEGKGDIKCVCKTQQGGIQVTLTDYGEPFEPEDVPTPAIGAPLDEFGPRGIGIYLIRKLMDQVEWEFKEGENSVILTKHAG